MLSPTAERVILGNTDIAISPMGIGTWAWGDRVMWGYGKGYTDAEIRVAFDAAVAAGVNFFDTAEVYGLGRSERLLGQFIRESGQSVVVASKFMPFPFWLTKGALRRELRGSLKRLGMTQVDLYQMHFPLPPVPVETWMEAMADAVEAGLVRAVGVSNYNQAQMERAYRALSRRGIHLASNQVFYSLLHRDPEFNGVAQLCRDLNITLIAYSPLEKGILTGKYTPQNPPPGMRKRIYNQEYLQKAQPLLEIMRGIGESHGGKTEAQVALNWLICKGAVPIPGAKNQRQVASNVGALGWRLTDDEVAILDDLSLAVRK
ncbi:MAG TPA: aldo/keto reductase [Anaerolineae bacterium]|nr:aldo/keto reductase [Anaerolineae bacterium]HQK13766.1 aldo/keto reductase [Anaerolineae bacterium]